ncbi:MAG: UspA domain-containing protein [Nitrosopumilales archaeon]|nr:MAG: UspA domain-containing protein [Nitrosopumilales archaeon]
MLFKNILVPFDGSKCALHAFKIALDLAKNYDSKLTVVSCITKSQYSGRWFVDYGIREELTKNQMKEVTKSFSKLKSLSLKKGVDIKTEVLNNYSVVKKLASFAKSNKVDLIVMGTQGKTGWNKLILGSVANGVSRLVSCPVLVVR